jgi:hypothetical protein
MRVGEWEGSLFGRPSFLIIYENHPWTNTLDLGERSVKLFEAVTALLVR